MKKMFLSILVATFVMAACSPAASTPTATAAPDAYAAPKSTDASAPVATEAGYAAPAAVVEVPTPAGYAAPEPVNTNINLQVASPDGKVTTFGADQFAALPMTDENGHKGVRLTDLIAAVGVSDYTEVVLDAADKTMSYTKGQITADMILENTGNSGGMLFLSPTLAEDQWLHNIVMVKIK